MIGPYSFGRVVVDGETFGNDVLVFPERVEEWWREEGHLVLQRDLEEVFEASPEVLVVGTGAYGRMEVSSGAREALESRGIRLVARGTEDACRRFNELPRERAIAALHLTC